MKRNFLYIMILTLFLSVVSNGYAANIEERMDKIVFEKELDFKNVPLSDVLGVITKTSGITIVPESEVGNINIDIYFGRGQSLGEIIRTLKVTHGLKSRELNSVLILGKNISGQDGSGGKIIGRILSKKSGEGIENAKIYLVGKEEEATISLVEGNYILPNIDAGTYILKVESTMYKSTGTIVEINDDTILSTDIVMELNQTAEAIIDEALAKNNDTSTKSLGSVTTSDGSKLTTEKIILKHGFPSEVKAVLDSVVEDIEITAVEKQNILVLKGEDSNIDTAKQLIKELDKPIKQVRITAQILEVTGSLSEELGVDWTYYSNSNVGPDTLPDEGYTIGIPSGVINFTEYLSSAGDFIKAKVDILQTTQDANLAAIPSIVTLNGEKAELRVSSEKNIGTTERTDDDGNTIKEPTFKEAGTILTVTPIIRDGEDEPDTITLTINSEVSSFVNTGASSSEDSESKGAAQKNSATTKVRVQDGGIIFIGGLQRTEVTNTVTKIPLLGDIPILGRLFKQEGVATNKKDIYIQIKAEIVTVENQNNDITGEGFKKSTVDFKERIFPGGKTN